MGGAAPEKGGTQPWNDDKFDVLADSAVVGRIMKITARHGTTPPWV
jgi:hypothetical protein